MAENYFLILSTLRVHSPFSSSLIPPHVTERTESSHTFISAQLLGYQRACVTQLGEDFTAPEMDGGDFVCLWVYGCRARKVGATCRPLGTSFTVRGWPAGWTFLPRLAGCDFCSDPPVSPSIITVSAPSMTPSYLILNYSPPHQPTGPGGSRWTLIGTRGACERLGGESVGGVLWVLEWGAGSRGSLWEGLWRGGSWSPQASKPTPVSTCYWREWPRHGLSLAQSPPALLTQACHFSLCGLGTGLAHLCVCFPNCTHGGRLIYKSFASFQTC